MIRILVEYISKKLSQNFPANITQPESTENISKNQSDESQEPTTNRAHISHNKQNIISCDASFYGKILHADICDDIHLFEIKRDRDEEKILVSVSGLKWNPIVNDKVLVIVSKKEDGKFEFKDVRPKKKVDFEYGRVTHMDGKHAAVFENKAILLFNALEKCPVLQMYDEYRYETVESDQKFGTTHLDYRIICLHEKVEIAAKGNGIYFESDSPKIFVKEIGEDAKHALSWKIKITNKSNKRDVNLLRLNLIPGDSNMANILRLNKEVAPYNLIKNKGFFKVLCKISPIKEGKFNYTLIAEFKEFEEAFDFTIEVQKITTISGSRNTGPRFKDIRMDNYKIPEDLIAEINYDKIHEVKMKLVDLYPEINENLSPDNYCKKMDLGIYLEEISMIRAFKSYDIERGVFETKNKFLRLKVKDVAEKRPSIIVGDRLTAIDPFRTDNEKLAYEGIICKVEQDAILCKFLDGFHTQVYDERAKLSEFHNIHNEKEYKIEFHFSRTKFKRQHHAIHTITRVDRFGADFLFPSEKILRNKLQLKAMLADDESTLMINNDPQNWFYKDLNKYQKHAVVNVLRGEMKPLPYIFFGCPGSGKSRTVCETILQIFTHVESSKIIVATPSNSAANLITDMLLDSGALNLRNPPFLRIMSNNQVEKDLIPEHLRRFCGTVNVASETSKRREEPMRNECGILLNCSKSFIQDYQIIIGTLNCLGSLMEMDLRGFYSHVIIDEAAQSIEPEAIIPLTLLNKRRGQCVLSGDIKQLGPILISRLGNIFEYNSSMLERLLTTQSFYKRTYGPEGDEYDPKFVTKLKINYRSHPSILKLYNDLFYEGELEAAVDEDKSLEAQLLAYKTENVLWKNTNRKCGVYFVNVDNGVNKRIQNSCSWYNDMEIRRIISFLSKCSANDIHFKDIGICTPYALQVKKLKEEISLHLNDTDLKIGTVEEFQGQERMIVIVSTVRTSEIHLSKDARFGLGFIQCPKRMNVAISRARALLVVFGKEKILKMDETWRKLIEYTKNNNTYVVENSSQ